MRDVELETTAMAEAEDVEGDDGPIVVSDVGEANLCERRKGKEEEEEEEDGGEIHGGHGEGE